MALDIMQHYHNTHARLFLLDYDGTLADFAPTPAEAEPTPEILYILTALAADPANTVVVVSGRDRASMEEWLGDLPVALSAEHGLFLRPRGGEWQTAAALNQAWKPPIRELMEDAHVPGSDIEDKEMSLVWHYRGTDPAAADPAAEWLTSVLQEPSAALDLKIMSGHNIIEVTASGTDKGQAGRDMLAAGEYDFVLAAGDDTTDDDMFRAMPDGAHIIKVGAPSPLATHHVSDPEMLCLLLSSLTRSSTPADQN